MPGQGPEYVVSGSNRKGFWFLQWQNDPPLHCVPFPHATVQAAAVNETEEHLHSRERGVGGGGGAAHVDGEANGDAQRGVLWRGPSGLLCPGPKARRRHL
jgi:hypothetical protein